MSEAAELHLIKQRLAELESTVEIIDRGMTKKESKLRDQFAMAALPSMGEAIIENVTNVDQAINEIARLSYQMADAMMEAREK